MNFAPSPDEVTVPPYEGVPRFFRRVWDPGPAGTVEVGHVVVMTPSTPDGGLAIYGYSARSEYPEDHALEDQAWRRRKVFFAWNYSVMAPDGEPGMVPLAEVEEITRDEFELAQRRGWR